MLALAPPKVLLPKLAVDEVLFADPNAPVVLVLLAPKLVDVEPKTGVLFSAEGCAKTKAFVAGLLALSKNEPKALAGSVEFLLGIFPKGDAVVAGTVGVVFAMEPKKRLLLGVGAFDSDAGVPKQKPDDGVFGVEESKVG